MVVGDHLEAPAVVHIGNAGGLDQTVQEMGRCERMKGTEVELTGLAGGLDGGRKVRCLC